MCVVESFKITHNGQCVSKHTLGVFWTNIHGFIVDIAIDFSADVCIYACTYICTDVCMYACM